MSDGNFYIKIISTTDGEHAALTRDDVLKLVDDLNQGDKFEDDSLYNFLQHLLAAFDKAKD